MIYTLGETLLDIIFEQNGQVSATPGGAMLNVSVSLVRKGASVSLISELGDDKAGEIIKGFLNETGVCTQLISCYPMCKTSLALAFLDEQAKPTYQFYKSYPEVRLLRTKIKFTKNDYLLFGSVYSLDEAIRYDIKTIVKAAKSQNAVVVYDPNIRHAYHMSDSKLREAVSQNIAIADIIKGSDEDFFNIFGEGNPGIWVEQIKAINTEAVVIITLGEKGSRVYYGSKTISCSAQKVNVISTVGAGDAFSAGLLYKLDEMKKKPTKLTGDEWYKLLNVATFWASSVCASKENYIR